MIQDKETGHLLPETQLEEYAFMDLKEHMPIFAVAMEYQVNGYMRGYEAAIRKYEKPEDAEYLLSELKKKI